jgi:hypothetical protein
MSVTIEVEKLNYCVFKLERMLGPMFVALQTGLDLTGPYYTITRHLNSTVKSEVSE